MAKEKGYNPVQAQRKADKAKAIKKGKADNQARRNEKLAKRNPYRIQQQIDELKALKEGGGKLTHVEEQSLEALEKDLKAVKAARTALGDKAPTFGRGPRFGDGGGVLGKRRRDAEDASSDDSDVPSDVKKIPMPRDSPPPIPKEILDEWWARRRARRQASNANQEPLGEGRGHSVKEAAPAPAVAKTVYESKPMVRNLQKEAVSAFVPDVVRAKIDKGRGKGGLLEPEEADQLEREGYFNIPTNTASSVAGGSTKDLGKNPQAVTIEDVEDSDG